MENNKIGILDPDGINNNPFTNKPYSDNYKQLAKKWKELPAYTNPEKTIQNIIENQVILIVSGTGSGKTVLMPKFVMHTFNYKGKIAITLPKQTTAKEAAIYSANTLDVELGQQVGYKYRGSDKNAYNNNTNMLYATDGTIVAQLMKDPDLKEYNAVIIDEAHERKVQIDFLIYLLKQVVMKRNDFKLIIMSATIDHLIFYNYFIGTKYIHMNISGKTNYPVRPIFLDKPINKHEYMKAGIEKIKEILRVEKEGDIIFFVTSINEAFMVCNEIPQTDFCVEVYSGMDKHKQELAISKDLYKTELGKKRKIIVATNVAESSLTIDGIKFVIDAGYQYINYFDPDRESDVLEKVLISQASAKQRRGRTGRTSIGICYHLYTQREYEGMNKFNLPEIKTANIYGECLHLLNFPLIQTIPNLKKVLTEFIEPPSEKYINYAIDLLLKLKLVEKDVITPLGKIISNMTIDPMQGLAIYHGYQLNCAKEIMMIVALMETSKNKISELFNAPNKNSPKYLKFLKIKEALGKKSGDHMTFLHLMHKYHKLSKKNEKELNTWLYENHLKKHIFEKSYKYYKKMKNQVLEILKNANLVNIENSTKYKQKDKVLGSFMGGYYTNTQTKKNISKDSWLKNKKNVIYAKLFTNNNQTEMQICSNITKSAKEIYNIIKIQ